MALKSIETFSAVPLFKELDESLLEVVKCAAISRQFQAGETVILQGDPCVGLYIVREGWLKGVITSLLGREQIIRLLGPGDVFNETGLLTDGRNPVTVRALEDSVLWLVERETTTKLMDKYPVFSRAITRNTAENVFQLIKLVEDLSLRTVKSRMARILLENSVEGLINRRRWMTQTEMAARLGTVLDVANRTLNSLEAEGLISVNRNGIQILDRKRLEELANLEE
jgi:CRP/FNR family cyclic AMP-dependent transcriptional regulator